MKGPVFTKADLKRIALRPVDVPAGLAYDRTQSGPGSLEQLLVVPRRIRAVRERGFRGLYTVVYNSKSSSEDRVLGERIWLFRTPRGASAFLADSLQEAIGLQAATIDAPDLGNESWAIRALVQVATGEIITHGFRIGNSVFIVNIYGQATPVTQAEALRAAKKALARAAPA